MAGPRVFYFLSPELLFLEEIFHLVFKCHCSFWIILSNPLFLVRRPSVIGYFLHLCVYLNYVLYSLKKERIMFCNGILLKFSSASVDC